MPFFSLTISKCFRATQIAFSLSFYLLIVNSTMLQTPSPPNTCNKDPYTQLGLILNPNGTVTRLNKLPESPPSPDPKLPTEVLSKDLTINKTKGTWARIYLPRETLEPGSKLPLVIFFHGGGFVLHSAATTVFDNFCSNMSKDVVAVVASIEYRLAPEHRLPAAYDDAVEALHWIKTNQTDDWLRDYVDYSNVFLMGGSAGGNIAYNAVLRVASSDKYEVPMIAGLILDQPFFGGINRTCSELRMPDDPYLPLCDNDAMWELSLPVGADRDNEYCNPTVGDGPKKLEKIGRLGWPVLVTGCTGDPLVDRQMELVTLMKKEGVKVEAFFGAGGYHGVSNDPSVAKVLYRVIKSFISTLPPQY